MVKQFRSLFFTTIFLMMSASVLAPVFTPAFSQGKQLETSLAGAFNVDGLTEQPVLFAADSLSYKNGGEIVEAKGNVEIRQAGRIIVADRLVFNRTTEEILAVGNIRVEDEAGNLIRTDKLALDRNFTRGFMQNMQMLLKPDVHLAANYGERSGGDRLALYKSVFSPCPACEKDPEKERLWQIKAGQIELDEKKQVISYKNITFEIRGVPVFYLPFFAHTDPRIKRQSGFLTPSLASASSKGSGIIMPYFIDLGESRDITVRPSVYFGMKDQIGGFGGVGGASVDAEFRQALKGGALNVQTFGVVERRGSYFDNGLFGTNDSVYSGALRVKLETDLGSHARVTGNYAGWTKREYFNEMEIDSASYSQRDIDFEGFWRRSYGTIAGVDQYVLRDSLVATGDTLPDSAVAEINYVSEPIWKSAKVSVNTQAKGLYREMGRDYARMSTDAKVTLPLTTSFGMQTTFSAGGFGAFYKLHQADVTNTLNTSASTFTGNESRIHSAASVRVEWPFASTNGDFDQVIEPVVQAVYAGKDQSGTFVSNEDSVGLSLTEGNMFNLWRTNGLDKVDAGSRVDYGVRYNLSKGSDNWLRVFVGQSLRQDSLTGLWASGSALEDELSHVIGSVVFDPSDTFDATWSFNYDVDDGEFYNTDVDVALKMDKASLTASYESGRTNATTLSLQNMSVGLNLKPLDFLSANIAYYENLLVANDRSYSGSISFSPTDRLTLTTGYTYKELSDDKTFSGSVAYVHPCLNFSVAGTRQIDAAGTPEDKFSFRLGLKYLGDTQR